MQFFIKGENQVKTTPSLYNTEGQIKEFSVALCQAGQGCIQGIYPICLKLRVVEEGEK